MLKNKFSIMKNRFNITETIWIKSIVQKVVLNRTRENDDNNNNQYKKTNSSIIHAIKIINLTNFVTLINSKRITNWKLLQHASEQQAHTYENEKWKK